MKYVVFIALSIFVMTTIDSVYWLYLIAFVVVILFIGFLSEKKSKKRKKNIPTTQSEKKDIVPYLVSDLAVNSYDTTEVSTSIVCCTEVAGIYYRPKSVHKMVRDIDGCDLELKQDKKNAHDEYAVKVFAYDFDKMKDVFIGYVPMEYSKDVFELLEDGEDVFATVTNVSDHDVPYVDIDIMVRK